MNTYHLTVSTPDGNLFDGDAVSISVRGSEGDLAILAGHMPFITSVQPGKCVIELPDGTTKEGMSKGGLLTVSSESVIFLSGSFSW